MELNSQDDFIDFLNLELSRRKDANKRYSLRAFARDLILEPSLLSKILRRQYQLTPGMMRRIGENLEFSSNEIESLISRVQQARQDLRLGRRAQSHEFLAFAQDHFIYLSQWHYIALLHLIETSDFQPSTSWCAKRLMLSEDLVEDAFARLERLGYLEILPDGRVKKNECQYSTIDFGDTTEYHRKLQRQFLEKAAQAMDEIPFNKRHQSTLTFSVNSRLLPKMIKEIHAFRRQMNAMAAESDSSDEVYNLSLSLYPLTDRSET